MQRRGAPASVAWRRNTINLGSRNSSEDHEIVESNSYHKGYIAFNSLQLACASLRVVAKSSSPAAPAPRALALIALNTKEKCLFL